MNREYYIFSFIMTICGLLEVIALFNLNSQALERSNDKKVYKYINNIYNIIIIFIY